MNRRSILKGLGGVSALGVVNSTANTDTNQSNQQELVINCPTNGGRGVSYAFSVGGEVEKTANPTMANVDSSKVTIDPEDDIDACVVHGTSAGGYDAYLFTGKLTAFDIPERWEDKSNLWMNGEKRAVSAYNNGNPQAASCAGSKTGDGQDDTGSGDTSNSSDDDFCQLSNTIELEQKVVGDRFTFEIGVSGVLELDNGQRVERVKGELDPHYQTRKQYEYSGAITALTTSGEGMVSIDQSGDCE